MIAQDSAVELGSEEKSYNPDFDAQLQTNLASIRAAYSVGLKSIVRDINIICLTGETEERLKSASFNGRGSLKDHIKVLLKRYCYEDGFYGVILGDEPSYDKATEYGLIYKAIKQASAELGVECEVRVNLLPFASDGFTAMRFPETDGNGGKLSYEKAYEKYLTDFIKASNATEISIDLYPYRGSGTDVYDGLYANLQIFAKVCTENGVEMRFILQSFADAMGNGNINHAIVDEDMMRMQLATCIGFGIKKFGYFTYAQSEWTTVSDGSFLNADGSKTEIYNAGKTVMSEAKAIEKVLMNYSFNGSNIYVSDSPQFSSTSDSLSATINYSGGGSSTVSYQKNSCEFDRIKDFSCDNDIALVTELFDKDNEIYMYMVQNAIDTRNGGDTSATMTVEFGASYTHVIEYRNGVRSDVVCTGGVYQVELNAGEAVYLIPLL